MLGRSKPADQPAAGANLAQALLAWSVQFEGGFLSDPALIDGTLGRGERFATRISPAVAADLRVTPNVEVTAAGPEGAFIATDRRAIFMSGGTVTEWAWDADVDRVTVLPGGIGCMWTPSESRYEAGVRMQGVVLPGYLRGEPPAGAEAAGFMVEFTKVIVAWRTSQPGGVAAWAAEFRSSTADPLD